ncbi:zinc-binding alcohol dehydrogenase family protein [Bosea sp. AS-1]|uniref:quinone oxidoreductase family protein n=1 Tax=Bosea sp. AS-1 TaxID=2015316 RepID=UPI000B784A14|nr:zinc-binding alcohol dehydrogenase family protein [Bosea sp. AS-1]
MATMKALQFDSYGPPSALSLRDVDRPVPAPGEALVELRASAINPSDVKNVAGWFKASLPRVPGRDYAGVVVAGDGWVGKEVWGSGAGLGVTRDGSHAQYLVVALDALSEKPKGLSMEQAAAIGVPYLAAWSGLVDGAGIRAGETLAITGAAGAVGRAATQIAHWKGARVIGADIVKEVPGTDAYIDLRKKKDLTAEVRALTGGKGADIVFDTVGGALFEPCLAALGIGGRQIAIASGGQRRVTFDLVDFYHDLHHLIGVDTMKLSGPQIAAIMDQLRSGFDAGHLQAPPVQGWPIGAATEAYGEVGKGGSSTKHVLLPAQA